MKNLGTSKAAALLLAAGILHPILVHAQTGGPIACKKAIDALWADRQAHPELYPDKGDATHPGTFELALQHTLAPGTSQGCAAEYLNATKDFHDLREQTMALFMPARANLLKGLQNYSAQQQQGSTNTSAASVSPVSKASGLSGVAEEFSGVNISSGTSALTFQFAGTAVDNLEQTGVVLPCSSVLHVKSDCLSGFGYKLIDSLTLSFTANTSTTSQSVTGTASSAASGSTTAAATLSNAGSTEPSFGGFGIKGVPFYFGSAGSKSNNAALLQQQDVHMSAFSAQSANKLLSCAAWNSALNAAANTLQAQPDQASFDDALSRLDPVLGEAFLSCLQNDKDLVTDMSNLLATDLIEMAINRDVNAGKTSMLGFEYDFSTPVNQPSYSSVKSNFSWSFGQSSTQKATSAADKGKPATNTLATTTPCTQTTQTPGLGHAACAAAGGALALTQNPATPAGNKAAITAPTSGADAKAGAAANTKSWTINASVTADLYNSKPPSSIPSASHLRDIAAGAEIDYVVPTSKIKWVGSIIGDSTAAGSYYYQDQTSPSILKGPPSTITIADLPTTATTVYATRGPINLGQIRYGFGTGSNVSFPICFTYSNRSELITKPIKGLQFGLSYNLSSLFSSASSK